jgi:hypothetical protein
VGQQSANADKFPGYFLRAAAIYGSGNAAETENEEIEEVSEPSGTLSVIAGNGTSGTRAAAATSPPATRSAWVCAACRNGRGEFLLAWHGYLGQRQRNCE